MNNIANNPWGIEYRTEVLMAALALESHTSTFLAKLLGIDDVKNTKSFGNKSGNLSFTNKIQLLIEIDAIPKDEKKKFQTFMEVRNQFMHNIEAQSYVDCYNNIDGKEKFILKLYPQNEALERESKLRFATNKLSVELIDIINTLPAKIFSKEMKALGSELAGVLLKKHKETSMSMQDIFESKIKLKVDLNEGLTSEELMSLSQEIEDTYQNLWKNIKA